VKVAVADATAAAATVAMTAVAKADTATNFK